MVGLFMKVLIVDDTASELARLKQIIERTGHQVVCAKDGVEAIAAANAEPPDLVFMDIVMPRMDGFRACRHFKQDPKLSHIPIVLVSTKNDVADKAWAVRQGASTLIGKPFAPAQIIEQLSLHNRS